jgi:thiol:disulfide interchange protein
MKKTIFFSLIACGLFISSCQKKAIKVTSLPSPKTKAEEPIKKPETPVEPEIETRVAFIKSEDLEAALKQAKAEKKPVFIDFYAIWCAPCKVLDESVFRDWDVADYMNKNVISLKVDVDKAAGRALKEKLWVSPLPTLLFINPNGDEIARKEGTLSIEDFKKLMKTAVWKVKNPAG